MLQAMAEQRRTMDFVVAVLNGLVGDYLHESGNALASPMCCIVDGKPLRLERAQVAAALPDAGARLVILVHGVMGSERVWQFADGSDYGSRLAQELGLTPLYLRYNSGRHISDNGEALDALLEELVAHWPVAVEEVTLICHSMGGLVARSACHAAAASGHGWLARVRRAFYIGTPHLGAPLERLGNVVTWALRAIANPYTRIVADVGNLRSSGIKDLRYANLHRADWEGADADALLEDRRHPVPLLPSIRHHLIAGTLSASPLVSLLFGDALVPVASATGRAPRGDRGGPLPAHHVRVIPSVAHVALAHDETVYAQLRAWMAEP